MTTKSRFSVSIAAATSLGVAALFLPGLGCTSKKDASSGGVPEPSALVSKGRVTYSTNCTACHNSDPRKAGSLGPDVFGASRELLEARILRAEYPAGYSPKRETHAMVALPHLKSEIGALQAYLNAP